MTVAEMGIIMYAATQGYLEDVEVDKVLDFEAALISFMNAEHASFMQEANETGSFDDAVEEYMKKAIDSFKSTQTW